MSKKSWPLFFIFLSVVIVLALVLILGGTNILVLTPKGFIAEKQKNLLFISTALMLLIVIPVFILTFCIAWKYRKDNQRAQYRPNWDYSFLAESIWWGFPLLIVIVLSVLTWTSAHTLNPFKTIASANRPMTIQVVALDWKWLFIYPEQKIASVNFVQFPEKTPITFEITSDAPMNSFWIPQLGGQIYAMAGMRTKLNLIAQEAGNFDGMSSNLSGKGFAGMKFIAKASSMADFSAWVQRVKGEAQPLTRDSYAALAKPSQYNPVEAFTLQDTDLFEWIIMKYMMPMSLSHYSNFSVFELFGIFRTPLFGRVSSHWPQSRNPCGRSNSAQKSLKTFKTLIVG